MTGLQACLALLVLLPLVPAPAMAWHEPLPPLVASHGLAGPGWVAYKVDLDGVSRLVADLSAVGHDHVSVGYALLDAQRILVDEGWISVDVGPDPSAQLRSEIVDVDAPPRTGIGATAGHVTTACDACLDGVHYVVLYAGGWVTEATLSLHAEGATLLATSTGDEAFSYTERDLPAFAHAEADASPVRAYALVAGSISVDVDHMLVGRLHTQDATLEAIASTPSGTRSCPCVFGGAADGPGPYAFTVQGGSAGLAGGFVLAGADVELPA